MLHHAIETFGVSIYRYAYNQLRSHHDAEDIYQETFTALYVSNTQFENDYHLKSWLMKVTANRCKNFRRNRATHRENLTDPKDTFVFESSSLPAEPEPDHRLWEIVDKLNDELRQVIYLHYVEGYSTNEIAQIAGVSPAAVRTRLFRARSKIRALLKGGYGGRVLPEVPGSTLQHSSED